MNAQQHAPEPGNNDGAQPSSFAPHEHASAPSPGVTATLLSAVCVLGGVVRDTVFVTLDALRGRYDH
jgi:hypothetical protein